MPTNLLQLPGIYFEATTWTNGEWDDSIVFMNASAPVDITGIGFICTWRREADQAGNTRALLASTANGLILNGGASGILTFACPAASMGGILPDAYLADLLAVADGRTRNLCAAAPSRILHRRGIS